MPAALQADDDRDPDTTARQAEFYAQYNRAQEAGYFGSFSRYLVESGLDSSVEPAAALDRAVPLDNSQEEPVAKGDNAIDAHHSNLTAISPYNLTLAVARSDEDASGEDEEDSLDVVSSVETVLAALEGMHVDNARIEIEGGSEVPGLDGSAQPWMERIAVCGLRPAPPSAERQADADPGEGDPAARIARKMCWLPLRPITVYSPDITRGGAWAALYPCGVEHRLTAGVERDVPAIGQQWLTIDGASTSVPEDGLIFAMDIAPARTWLESLDEAYALQEEGFLMAGTSGSVLVADGRDWLSSTDIRFPSNEPVRHALLDLMGDLALAGSNGNSGIPCGHVVTYNADHTLRQLLVREILAAKDSGHVVEFPFMLSPPEVAQLAEAHQAEAAASSGTTESERLRIVREEQAEEPDIFRGEAAEEGDEDEEEFESDEDVKN